MNKDNPIYLITKPAFIKVVNQSVASPSDPNPEFVNSVDYGYPPVMPLEKNSSYRLSKSLLDQQAQILKDSVEPFGSGLVLLDDPNAVFNFESTASNKERRLLIELISSKRKVDFRKELQKLLKRFNGGSGLDGLDNIV